MLREHINVAGKQCWCNECEIHHHLMPDGRCSCPHTCKNCGVEYIGNNHSNEDCIKVLKEHIRFLEGK